MTGETAEIRRRAFTMLEILIAIGIIAILASLLVMGIRSVIGGSKAESTKVTLNALQGMLAEFQAKTGTTKSPQAWRWWNSGNAITATPDTDTARVKRVNPSAPPSPPRDYLWHVAADEAMPGAFNPPAFRNNDGPPRLYDSLDAPGLVASSEGNVHDPNNASRNASRAVLNTEVVMSMLLTVPSNRQALEKISA